MTAGAFTPGVNPNRIRPSTEPPKDTAPAPSLQNPMPAAIPFKGHTRLDGSRQSDTPAGSQTAPSFLRDRLVTTATTMYPSDDVILVDTTAGAVVLTALAANTMRGRIVTVTKVDAAANNVTFTCAGTDLVNGAATLAFNTQWMSKRFYAALMSATNTYGWIVL